MATQQTVVATPAVLEAKSGMVELVPGLSIKAEHQAKYLEDLVEDRLDRWFQHDGVIEPAGSIRKVWEYPILKTAYGTLRGGNVVCIAIGAKFAENIRSFSGDTLA